VHSTEIFFAPGSEPIPECRTFQLHRRLHPPAPVSGQRQDNTSPVRRSVCVAISPNRTSSRVRRLAALRSMLTASATALGVRDRMS